MNDHKNRLNDLLNKQKEMKERYLKLNLPLDIYQASQSDIHYRLNRFKEHYGYEGISEKDMVWLDDVFKAKFFNIGVLRYQLFTMDYQLIERSGFDYIKLDEKSKERFKEGQVYVNVHIAKDTNLDPVLVAESFDKARQFFKTYFNSLNLEYFICRTWLIDASLREILPSDSNIIQFANLFEPIARGLNYRQPFSRIYNTEDINEVLKREHTTYLQKKAYKHKDTLGVTFGCIPF